MEQITFSGSNEQLFSRVKVQPLQGKITLIVPETHNAILILDGQMLQTLAPGKYLISDFVDFKEETDANVEVLFLSKTAKLKLLWGTAQKILIFDQKLEQNFHIGFSGDFEVQVGDPRKCYLYIVGVSEDLTAQALQDRLRSNVVSVVEEVVSEFLSANNIEVPKISTCKAQISQKVLSKLSHKLESEYGIKVFSFNIANIIFDEEDFSRKTTGQKQVCANCGKTLEQNAKFCPECGTAVARFCSGCHQKIEGGDKFCPNCGQKIED